MLFRSEVTVRRLHHVVKQAILHFSIVVLGLHLQEVRLLNPDLQHAARLLESVEDVVGNLVVRSFPLVGLLGVLVDHDPLFPQQVLSFLDRGPLEPVLVALHDLVSLDDVHHGGTEDEAIQLDGDLLDLQTPALHRLLLCESVDHPLDLSYLFLRRDASHSQGIPHASALADGVRDTIEEAKLRRQVVRLVADFDQEAGLVEVRDVLPVGGREVLSNSHFSVVPGEGGVRRRAVEVDIFNMVGPLIAPISND